MSDILDVIAPKVGGMPGLAAIMRQGVESGEIESRDAEEILELCSRLPPEAVTGVRVHVSRLGAEARSAIGVGWLEAILMRGGCGVMDDGSDILVVKARKHQCKPASHTFAHENAHIIFRRLLTEPEKAEVVRLYKESPSPSRHLLHIINYRSFEERAEEWFAESFVDWCRLRGHLKGSPVRPSLEIGSLDYVCGFVWKRIRDLFSGERKAIDSFFDGLTARLASGFGDKVSASGKQCRMGHLEGCEAEVSWPDGSFVRYDPEGRVHCEDDAAVRDRDGHEIRFTHGSRDDPASRNSITPRI